MTTDYMKAVNVKKMREDLERFGHFLVMADKNEHEYVNTVLPGYQKLGDIKKILGYEPENYKLMSVIRHDGFLYTVFDSGNCWTGYGKLEHDDEFALEIEEKLLAVVQKIAWVSEDNGEFIVLKDAVDKVAGNVYETIESGFETKEEADLYVEEYNQVHHDTMRTIIREVAEEFPYRSKQTHMSMQTTFKELLADRLHKLEILMRLEISIGVECDNDYEQWETLQDVFDGFKSILQGP